MDWKNCKVLVTGGTSFIGSGIVDSLVTRGAKIRVVDDLSSGRLENIEHHVKQGAAEFVQADLRQPGAAERVVKGMNVVFHLAADHGGRGYVDLHQAACATNLMLDGVVFRACHEAKVDKVVYASSGCVYPNHIQTDPKQILYLSEDMVGPPYDADNMYGWAKLMAEMTLQSYYKDWGMKSASCRYFTVYGPRGVENHAVIAMIARAFINQNPFVVWGTGEQIRNWTYIDDIVSGTILAAEKINDATAVNLGNDGTYQGNRRRKGSSSLHGQARRVRAASRDAHRPAQSRRRQRPGEENSGLGAEGKFHRRPSPHHRLVRFREKSEASLRATASRTHRALRGVSPSQRSGPALDRPLEESFPVSDRAAAPVPARSEFQIDILSNTHNRWSDSIVVFETLVNV